VPDYWATTYHRLREPVNLKTAARDAKSLSASIHAAATATTTAARAADALEAVPAVNRTIAARLERHLRRLATGAACNVEHFALDTGAAAETTAVAATTTAAFALATAHGTAGTASLGLAEAARSVEFLVVAAELEFLSAVRAG
jgi:hypothetical protein